MSPRTRKNPTLSEKNEDLKDVYGPGMYRWVQEVISARNALAHGQFNAEVLAPRRHVDQLFQWFDNALKLFESAR